MLLGWSRCINVHTPGPIVGNTARLDGMCPLDLPELDSISNDFTLNVIFLIKCDGLSEE